MNWNSKRERFTTSSSASTWAKSGLTVAFSVIPVVMLTFRSPPSFRCMPLSRSVAAMGKTGVGAVSVNREDWAPSTVKGVACTRPPGVMSDRFVRPTALAEAVQRLVAVSQAQRNPERFLPGALYAASEVDAPRLIAAPRKPEGVERDHVLGRPSVIINLAGRVPQPVPVTVGVIALGADEGVGPGAIRIDLELEGLAVVVERRDDNRDHVVGETHPRVPLHVRRHDLLRIRIEADESHVQVLVVVHYPDFGGIGGRCALDRFELEEIVGDVRLLPFEFVEMAVHLDGGTSPGLASSM